MELASAALERQVTYSVILPEGQGAGPFPVVYLLHGRTDDHRAWLQRSNVVRHLQGTPLIVVMPDGGNSFYADLHPLMKYEQMIVFDLDAHVRRTFHVRAGRAGISGLSMGGYGAIRLGLKYPDKYASIYAHSSRIPSRAELPSLGWAQGVDPDELDLYAQIDRLDQAGRAAMARLSFDCGTEDHLLQDSRDFHAHLLARGVPHTYREHPGAHTWDYWDRHVVTAIAQHLEVLAPLATVT